MRFQGSTDMHHCIPRFSPHAHAGMVQATHWSGRTTLSFLSSHVATSADLTPTNHTPCSWATSTKSRVKSQFARNTTAIWREEIKSERIHDGSQRGRRLSEAAVLLSSCLKESSITRERGSSGVWPPPNPKEYPDSQKLSPVESPIKLPILKNFSFASSFVSFCS